MSPCAARASFMTSSSHPAALGVGRGDQLGWASTIDAEYVALTPSGRRAGHDGPGVPRSSEAVVLDSPQAGRHDSTGAPPLGLKARA